MTTELEEQFFKVFGIEPKNKCGKNLIYPNCLNPDKCGYDNCIYYQIEYPDITNEILVRLICILNSTFPTLQNACGSDRETLLKYVLTTCIGHGSYVKQKIQSLFEEGE